MIVKRLGLGVEHSHGCCFPPARNLIRVLERVVSFSRIRYCQGLVNTSLSYICGGSSCHSLRLGGPPRYHLRNKLRNQPLRLLPVPSLHRHPFLRWCSFLPLTTTTSTSLNPFLSIRHLVSASATIQCPWDKKVVCIGTTKVVGWSMESWFGHKHVFLRASSCRIRMHLWLDSLSSHLAPSTITNPTSFSSNLLTGHWFSLQTGHIDHARHKSTELCEAAVWF